MVFTLYVSPTGHNYEPYGPPVETQTLLIRLAIQEVFNGSRVKYAEHDGSITAVPQPWIADDLYELEQNVKIIKALNDYADSDYFIDYVGEEDMINICDGSSDNIVVSANTFNSPSIYDFIDQVATDGLSECHSAPVNCGSKNIGQCRRECPYLHDVLRDFLAGKS